MAIYKLFPYKDSTLYSLYPTANMGLDSILEAASSFGKDGASNIFRFLLAFDQDEIDDVINNKISGSLWQSNLRCYIANAEGIVFNSTLYTYPAADSWENGSGHFGDNPVTTDGVSWKWRDAVDGDSWPISLYPIYTTGSYGNTVAGGGIWFTGSPDPLLNVVSSQSFDIRSNKDFNMVVTDTVKAWHSGSIVNNGFLIKWSDYIEYPHTSSTSPYVAEGYVIVGYVGLEPIIVPITSVRPSLKFFSVDTHTIYPPELEFKWVDYTFDTGSSPQTIINTSQLYASITENPGYFYPESVNRFRVECRPQYPPRTFQTSSVYVNNYYLPENSCYAIKDLDTNEYVIDFDNQYTQISADSNSNYFDVYMNGLQPERYYKILIKTVVNNSTVILDNNYYFKIING
jgi:hypothetical protein